MPDSNPSTKYTKGNLYRIPIDRLQPDPDQPRKYFDPVAMEELQKSIQAKGILQPVLFRKDDQGNLILVSGERRYQAAKGVGLKELPAIYMDGNHAEIALIENMLRENLTAIEEAEGLDRLAKEAGYTQEQLADMIGKSRPTVSDILSLVKLPEDIRDECRSNPKCSRRVLLEIVHKKTQKGMRSLYRKYKEQGLTSDELRKSVKRPRKEKTVAVNSQIAGVVKKLKAVQAEWQAEEKEGLKDGLTELRALVDEILGGMS